jgi:hypothetical protein
MKKALVALTIACMASSSVGQQPDVVAEAAKTEPLTAIASNGRTVILKDDGTWEYEKADKAKPGGQFRKLAWGSTVAEIRKAEGAPASQSEGVITTLLYKGKLAGLDVAYAFICPHGKLTRGKYVVTERHVNKTLYLTSDYAKLKARLDEKYGAGKETYHWSNDLYRDDPSDWGTAISIGHLTVYSAWMTPDTEIYLALTGDNFNLTLGLEYQSKKLGKLEDAAKKKKDNDGF